MLEWDPVPLLRNCLCMLGWLCGPSGAETLKGVRGQNNNLLIMAIFGKA